MSHPAPLSARKRLQAKRDLTLAVCRLVGASLRKNGAEHRLMAELLATCRELDAAETEYEARCAARGASAEQDGAAR